MLLLLQVLVQLLPISSSSRMQAASSRGCLYDLANPAAQALPGSITEDGAPDFDCLAARLAPNSCALLQAAAHELCIQEA
jgi:hypothetical protein